VKQRWRSRFHDARRHLRQAGIQLSSDENAPDDYIRLRQKWDRYIAAFADFLAYDPDEIEAGIAGSIGEPPQPQATTEREARDAHSGSQPRRIAS
jgi:hypothetical protein